MTDFDPQECKRLIEEFRKTMPSWQFVMTMCNQLEAAVREAERLSDLVTDFKQACVTNSHDYDSSTKTPADVDRLRAEVERLRAEVERLRADDKSAAGECLVPVQEMTPGSHLRRVVLANRMWRYERDKLNGELDDLRAQVASFNVGILPDGTGRYDMALVEKRKRKEVQAEIHDLRAQISALTEERDHALAHGVLSQRVCDLENENAHLRNAAGPDTIAAIDAYRAEKKP